MLYIDPGSGALLLQLLAAGLLGALFAFRSFADRVRSFVADLFSRKSDRGVPAGREHEIVAGGDDE